MSKGPEAKAEMYARGQLYASMGAFEHEPCIRVRRATPESDEINIHVGSLYYFTMSVADFRSLVQTVETIFPEIEFSPTTTAVML